MSWLCANWSVTEKGETRNNNRTPLVPVWSRSTSHIQAFNFLHTWAVYWFPYLHITSYKHTTHHDRTDHSGLHLQPSFPHTHRYQPKASMLYCRLFTLRKHKLLFFWQVHKTPHLPVIVQSLFPSPNFSSNDLARTTRRNGKKIGIRPRSLNYRSFTLVSIKILSFPPLQIPRSSPKPSPSSFHSAPLDCLLNIRWLPPEASPTSVGFLHSPSMQRRFYSINCVVVFQQSYPTQTDHHPPCSPCISIFPDSHIKIKSVAAHQ